MGREVAGSYHDRPTGSGYDQAVRPGGPVVAGQETRGSAVSSEEQHHVALPKLYGAPAHARPPRPVGAPTPRPFDPDDLPLEAFMTPEERALKEAVLGGSNGPAGRTGPDRGGAVLSGRPILQPRRFRLRALAARLLLAGSSGRGPTGEGEDAGESRVGFE